MKYILVFLLAVMAVGCNDSSQARSELINNDRGNNPYLGRFKQYATGTDVDVVVDTHTGCEYITKYNGGIQPIGNCKGNQ